MGRRVGIAVLGLTMLLTACSGSGDGGLGFLPADEEPTIDEVAAAATVLTGRWDDRLAFYATMAGHDRGYSAQQVIEHGGDLSADGVIAGVAPAGPALGMLTPLAAGDAVAPRFPAAPRSLGAVGLSPQNQFVDFIDASLGEVYDTARAHLDGETDFAQTIVEMTLLLGATGYSPEQIVEGIITDSWDIAINTGGGPCFVLTDGGALVVPARVPLKFVDMLCPGVFTPTTTSTTTTTTTNNSVTPGDAGFDGTYTGTATWLISIPSYEFLDTTVVATVAGGVIDLHVGYTLRWDRHLDNDVPTCTTTVHDVLRGTATVTAGGFAIPMAGVSREVVAAVGSDCDGVAGELMAEWSEDTATAIPMDATIADGLLTGRFFDGAIGITATRN